MNLTCVICNRNVEDSVHWTGDMFRWLKKNKRLRTDGFRFICLCDECFQKHINGKEDKDNG